MEWRPPELLGALGLKREGRAPAPVPECRSAGVQADPCLSYSSAQCFPCISSKGAGELKHLPPETNPGVVILVPVRQRHEEESLVFTHQPALSPSSTPGQGETLSQNQGEDNTLSFTHTGARIPTLTHTPAHPDTNPGQAWSV